MRPSPAIGWLLLMVAALAAALGSLPVQLAFAVVAIGVVGMAHGASDLAIVAPSRRPLFLILYVAACLTCLIWWIGDPGIALPLFLLASALHFGMEDAPDGSLAERAARGVALVGAPAVLHRAGYGAILSYAGGDGGVAAAVQPIAAAGALAAGYTLVLAIRRRDRRLLVGTAALLLLPPLIGFSVGFLLLHALPQTDHRRRQMRCADHRAYLRAVAPILLAAILIALSIGALMLYHEGTGVRALFAGIAALAMPHLLVTPWFEAETAVPSLAIGKHGRSLPS